MVNSSKILIKKKKVSYSKWGYIFIAAFFIVYLIFTLYPQLLTIYDSFFDYSKILNKATTEQPTFGGFINYVRIFTPDEQMKYIKIFHYFRNTAIMWIIGAIPQFLVSILLALLFTSTRLKLKCLGAFKSIYYMPNLIMASAFAALFLCLFSGSGAIHQFMVQKGWIGVNFDFISNKSNTAWWLVAFMNFLMWFGNTTILLMAGIQGIDESLFEAARIDGANSRRVLFDITLPLLKPIVVYVFITSLIGGLQMYDVPQVLTVKGKSYNNYDCMTMVMYLNQMLGIYDYGRAGAISVVLFIITMAISLLFFKVINRKEA